MKLSIISKSTDGCTNYTDVVCLRSPDWIEKNHVKEGAKIWFTDPEMFTSAWATVVEVGRAPPIKNGTGRVVLTTFAHSHCEIWKLTLSQGEPIEVTPGHPIYSVTRHAFIQAGYLHPGEQVYGRDGKVQLKVKSVVSEHRFAPTYTFEVETDHHYFVGNEQLLVHNDSPRLGQEAADELAKANLPPEEPVTPNYGKPKPDASDRTFTNDDQKWHYTDLPDLEGQSLLPNKWVTDAGTLTYDRALPITFLQSSPPILFKYPVQTPRPMQYYGRVNGVNQWQATLGQPPGSIGAPIPVLKPDN